MHKFKVLLLILLGSFKVQCCFGVVLIVPIDDQLDPLIFRQVLGEILGVVRVVL